MPLPLEVIDFIRRRLDNAKALQPCKSCGASTFDIAEDMFFGIMCIPSPIPQQVTLTPNRGMPMAATICTVCGAATFHSLKKLGILDEVNRRSMEIWQRTLQQSQTPQQGPLQSTQPAQMVVYHDLECFNCHSRKALVIAPHSPGALHMCPTCQSPNIRFASAQPEATTTAPDPASEVMPTASVTTQPAAPISTRPITKVSWDKKCQKCDQLVPRHLPGACKIDASGRCVCPPHRTHQCGRTTKKCAK